MHTRATVAFVVLERSHFIRCRPCWDVTYNIYLGGVQPELDV